MAGILKNISKRNRIRRSPDVTFGDVTYEPRSSFGPRMQPDFQLVIVHEGEAALTVDNAAHHLPARHVALLKPGGREYFAFSRTVATHHTWCAVAPRRVSKSLAAELASTPFCLPLTSRMQSLIELGLSAPLSDAPVAAALIERLGDAALQEYLAQATLTLDQGWGQGQGHGQAETALPPNALRRAVELIESDFATPLTLADLARAACCTPNHLTKLFRQHLNVTPARYLWRTRVNRGVELLGQTGLSVSEIAYQVGFQTPFHFSRRVKQQHALSPKALRARKWK